MPLPSSVRHPSRSDHTTRVFFDHSAAPRINTDAVVSAALKQQYPDLELVVTPDRSCPLLAYASAGHANYTLVEQSQGHNHDSSSSSSGSTRKTENHDSCRTSSNDSLPSSIQWRHYLPPARRLDGNAGGIGTSLEFGKFLYRWRGQEFILYVVDGRDGSSSYPQLMNNYILTRSTSEADALIMAAGQWGNVLHDEVWVFDQGYWQKSAELYRSAMSASWDAVILNPAMKKALIEDHLSFFDSRETYKGLNVPWKRGVIYYGPPGNGKTISVKAMMHTLYSRKDPVPTLYVRSLVSFGGPEASIRAIFARARQEAPCYLVFEDLDSMIDDNVRSYFLNEVDGLKSNDGIFMIGSTNHLDRLDPGISKRPSRFDRKYFFPDPNRAERTAYCRYWQSKLKDNQDIDFPDKLCIAIAGITDKFSFAYIQEAFVAALLAIARSGGKRVSRDFEDLTEEVGDGWLKVLSDDDDDDDDDDDLDGNILWIEIKKQVKILRDSMEQKARVR